MPRPDVSASAELASRLDAVVRRRRASDLLTAATVSSAAAALCVVLGIGVSGTPRGILLTAGAAAAIACALWLRRARRGWNPPEAARLLEYACPGSRNVIVTAEELMRKPGGARDAVRRRVAADAVLAASPVTPADAVPLTRKAVVCVAAVAALAIVSAIAGSERPRSAVRHAVEQATGGQGGWAAGGSRIIATITPPAYLGLEPRRFENPERIEAIAGSRLTVTIAGARRLWRVRLGPRVLASTATADGIVAETIAMESTYLAVEASDERSGTGARRLVPVVVTADRAPTITLERPGKDLLLPDAAATVPVSATAADDFGLASMELRFTRVTGSGEQFEFEEGTIPLELDRESARAWRGRAALRLSALKLQPGDALVYRVVGSDARAGEAGAASSETFFVEVAGPGEVTLAGFELPPDRERYAFSQQMIVLKIQRLRGREASMTREAVAEEAAAIAAEQRAVRANFIFLTGGHVEDEEAEAEHSHEIQEGRLEHTARREIGAAIQFMSRAEQALVAIQTGAALPPARAAVDALQRAFGRNRYFLRTLPVRSRVDPSRRLSGELETARDSRRDVPAAEVNASARTAREVLAELLDLAPALAERPGPSVLDRLSALGERTLSVDAGSPQWQRISGALIELRDSLARSGPKADIARYLEAAAAALVEEARRDAVPPVAIDPRSRVLLGAWSQPGGAR